MTKTTLEKVALERLIDQYLIRDIPLSILLESYNVTFPQMQLLMNRVRGFTRQADMLSENNDNFSYDDVAEDYLVIPHSFTEKYPLKHKTVIGFFERLSEIKKELSSLEKIDLNEHQEKVAATQAKVNSYDQVVIGNIESFMNDYDQVVREGRVVDEITLIRLLDKNHISIQESQNLNALYDDYLRDKERVIELEKELELKKISKKNYNKLEREYEDIREILVVHNVKLVNWCIRKFFNNIAIPKEETQAFGLEGLVRAINTFDYTKGFHFSTYAVVVIVRHIESHFEELYGMKWNDFINKNSIKYYRRLMMEEDPNRVTPPTAQELADMGLVSLSAAKIAELDSLAYPAQPLSNIHDELDDGYPKSRRTELPTSMDDYEKIDKYQDETEIVDEELDVAEIALNNQLRGDILVLLETLTSREAQILKLRYGLDDGHAYSLDEVAAMYGLTRERIRQIECKAIRKMRHPSRARKIRGYYDDYFDRGYNIRMTEAEKNSKDYLKLMDLLNKDISKEGMLAFMNMNGANWSELRLEMAISEITRITDYLVYCANNYSQNPYKLKTAIEENFDIIFTTDFIEYLLDLYKDLITQDPEPGAGTKKM